MQLHGIEEHFKDPKDEPVEWYIAEEDFGPDRVISISEDKVEQPYIVSVPEMVFRHYEVVAESEHEAETIVTDIQKAAPEHLGAIEVSVTDMERMEMGFNHWDSGTSKSARLKR
jgi:hypothetical protein